MIRVSLFAIALLVVTACKSPEQKLEKEIGKTVSANGTLRLTAESWLDNRLPRAYARLAVRTTRDDLESESSKVAKLKLSEAGALQREMESLSTVASDLQRGIENADRATVLRAHARLAASATVLQKIKERAEAAGQ